MPTTRQTEILQTVSVTCRTEDIYKLKTSSRLPHTNEHNMPAKVISPTGEPKNCKRLSRISQARVIENFKEPCKICLTETLLQPVNLYAGEAVKGGI